MYNLKDESTEFKKLEPLASIVKRLGCPESTLLLHTPCHIFQIPEIDGLIGYYRIRNCAVVIGEPICSPEDREELTKAFHRYCHERDLKMVYFLVYEEFARFAIDNGCRTLIQVGSELNLDPISFRVKQKLRWKINQSIQHGVQVEEYKTYDPELDEQIKNTLHLWSSERRGPQMHLGSLNFFKSDADKRVFYAKQEDKIVGVIMLSPVDRFEGWVVSAYLATQDAPVGTTEHLMCFVFETLASEDCHFLCLGAVSGTTLGEAIGLNPFGKLLGGLILKAARTVFKLDAKAIYFKKYHPSMRPTYLVCRGNLTVAELLAMKHVLNVKR